MEKEWITKEDVRSGIVQLLKNGKRLPFYRKIDDIRYNSEGSHEEIERACKAEALKQVAELTEQWYDIIVPAEEYRKQTKVMTKERWQLAIKETLKCEDYYRTLDFSLVAQGIDNADEIIKEKAIEEARERQGAWKKKFEDSFTDETRYMNIVLGKWTSARMKARCSFNVFPYYCGDVLPQVELDANRKMLMAEGRKLFPEASDEVLRRNLMLIGVNHVNKEHCEKYCDCKNCYMDGFPLTLNFDGERFYISNSEEPCSEYRKRLTSGKA